MPNTLFSGKKDMKSAILEAANIIIENADGLARDIEERYVNGINIYLSADAGEAPTLEITKTYYALPRKVQ